jgi:antitoxin component of MazEF toxin-antitoxin module
MPNSTNEGTATIARFGNEFILSLSSQFVAEAGIKEGDTLKLRFVRGATEVQLAKQRKRWVEAELLEGVTPDICGPEIITGCVGREIL